MKTVLINNVEFVFKVKFYYNNFMKLPEQSRKKMRSNGSTICSFTLSQKDSGVIVLAGTGYSRCSFHDMFSKRVGRYYAFARAVADSFYGKSHLFSNFLNIVVEDFVNLSTIPDQGNQKTFFEIVIDNLKNNKVYMAECKTLEPE